MEKTRLVGLIQEAKVSAELKTQLLGMVGEQEEVAPETIQNIKAELDRAAEAAIEDVVNMQVLEAKDEFDTSMAEVDSKISTFNQELRQKADEADMAAARDTISQQ